MYKKNIPQHLILFKNCVHRHGVEQYDKENICQLCGHFGKVITKKSHLNFSKVDRKNLIRRYNIKRNYLYLDLLPYLNFCSYSLMQIFNQEEHDVLNSQDIWWTNLFLE